MSLAPCDSRVNSASRWYKAEFTCLRPAMRHRPAFGRRHQCGVQLAEHVFCDCIFCDKPPGLGTPPLIRIEGQWTAFPAAMDLKRVAATRDNGLRANCRCPALATVLATEVHQGRTPRDMLQGRCQPHPPPSHTIRRMVSNPCRYAVGTTGCRGG